ncbi:hypothetical protein ARMSODRAFT_1083271 [Armillaria solidipes]|uniref:Uncharacterized protein n=1 Tax=Armillaria solidipes TaxID=1076256 RepID=A0A2H3C708_9AGAR|nr:hypothetical protein ARMSODRAFT_1083271 [Armillaria solidipes]
MLDIASSKRAARRCLANIINSTAFLIESVWTRGDLSELGEYSVRYADGGGCIAVAAGQTVVEICDNRTLSSETFDQYARKLLEYTVRRDSPPVAVPIIKRGPLIFLTSDDHNYSRPGKIQVRAVKSRFSLWFELEKLIAAADATVGRSAKAVSFEHYVVEEGVKVEFTFAVKRLGHHIVDVLAVFADSETMVSASQMAEVEVFTYN